MRNNQIIELAQYRQPEAFDFTAFNRRAERRFRNSEIRAWILYLVESIVTVAIGVCTVISVGLALTML